jgi:hypothetical protein
MARLWRNNFVQAPYDAHEFRAAVSRRGAFVQKRDRGTG